MIVNNRNIQLVFIILLETLNQYPPDNGEGMFVGEKRRKKGYCDVLSVVKVAKRGAKMGILYAESPFQKVLSHHQFKELRNLKIEIPYIEYLIF